MLTGLHNTLHDNGITHTTTIMASRFTEGAHWYCYEDPDSCGTLPDPTTVAATTAAATGLTVAASRDELDARFTRTEPEAQRRLAPWIDRAQASLDDADRCDDKAALSTDWRRSTTPCVPPAPATTPTTTPTSPT